MRYLDENEKTALSLVLYKQVKDFDAYLAETAAGWFPNELIDLYEETCADLLAVLDTNEDFKDVMADIGALNYDDEFTRTMSNYLYSLAMVWWSAGAYYEGKFPDDESPDSPIDYIFELMGQASTLCGILKCLAETQTARITQSKKAAKARWESDPKMEEKAFVKDCWQEWQNDPARYKNKSAFLRDMHLKLDNLTLYYPTLSNWIKVWRNEK